MHDKPLVTVICLCYNHAAFVLESLQSVINQEYSRIQLIVIDDCSNDNSNHTIQNWLEKHPDVLYVRNENNLGNTKTFNKALQYAKGDYVIDLAADDVLMPNCISLQIEKFKNSRYSNLGIVYGNAALITEKGDLDTYYFEVDAELKVINQRETGDIYTSVLSGGNSICSVSALVKKTVLDSLKGYDEALAYEDLDLWIRASRDYTFDFIDAVLVQKRIVSTSLNNQFYKSKSITAKKLNQSTFVILNKAFALNRSKSEDFALLKRVHHEIIQMISAKEYFLVIQYLQLRLSITFKKRK